ncbi:MAG: thioredoxin family protein [Deltaproteobacteria bacterium]|nr:thioredoxin family protein [Deltaproteobacteria bacterium]
MIIVYILLGIFALFMIIQIMTVMKIKGQKGKPAPALMGKMGKIIESGEKSLFYFYAPRCNACAKMTPWMKQFEKDKENVFVIDLSSDLNTARSFGVLATPTTIIIKDKIIQDVLLGPYTESTIAEILEK